MAFMRLAAAAATAAATATKTNARTLNDNFPSLFHAHHKIRGPNTIRANFILTAAKKKYNREVIWNVLNSHPGLTTYSYRKEEEKLDGEKKRQQP